MTKVSRIFVLSLAATLVASCFSPGAGGRFGRDRGTIDGCAAGRHDAPNYPSADMWVYSLYEIRYETDIEYRTSWDLAYEHCLQQELRFPTMAPG